MKIEKKIEAPYPDDFKDWEWGDGDLAPILQHIRATTATVIADQITDDCEGYIAEWDGLFHVKIWDDFIISFDIFKALAVGEIAFDDLDDLKSFSQKIDEVAANLHKSIEVAEKATS